MSAGQLALICAVIGVAPLPVAVALGRVISRRDQDTPRPPGVRP